MNRAMFAVGDVRTIAANVSKYTAGERLLFWHQIRIELEQYEDGPCNEVPNMSADIIEVAE
jgi:hypothetical protein